MRIVGPVILFILSVVNCATAEDRISIPAFAGLTGDALSFGSGEREGYELAIEERNAAGGINGKKVVLELQDTGSTTNGTLTAYKYLHDVKGHRVILGPTWADTFQGAIPAAFRDKSILITPSAEPRSIATNPGPSLFILYRPSAGEMETLFRHMKTEGVKKLGIVSEIEPFFTLVRKISLELCTKEGIACAPDIEIQQGESEMKSVLLRMTQGGVDAVLMLTAAQDTVLNFFKSRKQLAPSIPVYGVHDVEGYAAQPDFKPYLDNIFFTHPVIEDASFIERYTKRWGHAPMLTAPNAYDAIRILMDLIAEGITDPERTREALLNREFKSSAIGRVKFQKDGSISGGKFEVHKVVAGEILRPAPPVPMIVSRNEARH